LSFTEIFLHLFTPTALHLDIQVNTIREDPARSLVLEVSLQAAA